MVHCYIVCSRCRQNLKFGDSRCCFVEFLWSTEKNCTEFRAARSVRRGGLRVSVLDSGSSGPGSGSWNFLLVCVVFLGKTLNSHGTSLHPGV